MPESPPLFPHREPDPQAGLVGSHPPSHHQVAPTAAVRPEPGPAVLGCSASPARYPPAAPLRLQSPPVPEALSRSTRHLVGRVPKGRTRYTLRVVTSRPVALSAQLTFQPTPVRT